MGLNKILSLFLSSILCIFLNHGVNLLPSVSHEPMTWGSIFLVSANDAGATKKGSNVSETARAEASKLRSAGDTQMVSNALQPALDSFTKAITLEPDNPLNYYKRFRVYDKLKKTKQALGDLSTILSLDPKHVQALSLRARMYLNTGKCNEALADYREVLKIKSDHGDAMKMLQKVEQCADLINRAERLVAEKSWGNADQLLTEAMQITGGTAPHLKMLRAKARLEMGNYLECIADAGEVVKIESENIDALLLRGRAYYATADHEMTMRHLREALKFDPEHVEAKKLFNQLKRIISKYNAGEEAFNKGQFKEAFENYEAATEVDRGHVEFNKNVFLKMCKSLTELREIDKAMDVCDKALDIDGNMIEAHITIAEYLTKYADTPAEFENAIAGWRKALQIDRNNPTAQDGLRRAEAGLKQSKKKNYYKILDIPRHADVALIKRQYRKLAMVYHPGKLHMFDFF